MPYCTQVPGMCYTNYSINHPKYNHQDFIHCFEPDPDPVQLEHFVHLFSFLFNPRKKNTVLVT
jgi:hypothetical protein